MNLNNQTAIIFQTRASGFFNARIYNKVVITTMKLKEKLLSLLVRWLGFSLRARLPQVTPSPAISQDMSPDGNAVLPKVSLLALGKMAAEPGQSFNALPQLPLGVIPQQLLAQDGHTHASLAMAQDNAAFCHAFLNGAMQGTGFKGYAALAELSQLSEYRSPTETLATEMTRQWISFKSTGAENRSEQLQAIEAAFDQFKIRDKLKQAVEHDGFFGRGMLYIDMGMPELNDTPLIINKATIRPGSVQGFKVIEPVWTSPANYNAIDPTAKDFYQPHSWYVMGRQIHTSRLITLIARPLPDMLKPAYNFSGLSMTQLLEPAVNAWLRTRDSVSELVHSFSTSGVKTDMQAVLSGGNGDDILHRAQLFNQMRDNRGLMLLDKDNEEFFQFHTPLGGMESLQAQAQEQMAAPCHIPLVKLFGITPHGLNASSEGEIKVFYDYIQAMQQSLLTDPLLKILQIIQLHLFGEIYDDITFEYYPLEQMNEQQEVNISKTKVEIGTALLQAGVIRKEEERQRLAADPLSGYDGLGDGLSGQLPEQEQAGQSGVLDGMQAMDEAQCFWDPHKHPRNKENGQFCEVGAGAVSGVKVNPKKTEKPELAGSGGGGGSATTGQPEHNSGGSWRNAWQAGQRIKNTVKYGTFKTDEQIDDWGIGLQVANYLNVEADYLRAYPVGTDLVGLGLLGKPSFNKGWYDKISVRAAKSSEKVFVDFFSRLEKTTGPRGSHLLKHEHIGATLSALQNRLSTLPPRVLRTSSYTNASIAAKVIAQTLRANLADIKAWAATAKATDRPIAKSFQGSQIIGYGVTRTGGLQAEFYTNAVVVIKANGKGGYYILTSYPKP